MSRAVRATASAHGHPSSTLIIVNHVRAITAEQAADRLGVKVATVYAYVSRGALRSWRRPGSRASLFDPGEVEVLARRGRPRRTTRPPAVDFEIRTALTAVSADDICYRGRSALDLARHRRFEDVAELLWADQEPAASGAWVPAAITVPELGIGDRLRMAVILAAAADPSRADLTTAAVAQRGRSLIATMTASLPGQTRSRFPTLSLDDGRTIHRRTIAGQVWARLATVRPTTGLLAALNAALVLLADHELATSTLAARVAASARADPYAVVLAGLGTLSGALHGGASRLASRLIASAARTNPERALAEAIEAHQHLPGFGHPLYPNGDPRGRLLLDLLRSASPGQPGFEVAEAVITAARRHAGDEPNIDFALAALAVAAAMPEGAGETIFAIARSAGWIAHAIEEYGEQPLRFRPRAVPRTQHRDPPP